MQQIAPTKETMKQYNDMKEELQQIQADIQKTEDSIARLLAEGTVCDKVNGGLGGLQGFKIEGFPIVEFERRRRLLRNKKDRLIEKENDLLEITNGIETFIDGIPISMDRRIFREIFFENKTQQQVADGLSVDRSLISKIISKYLQVSHNSQKK